MEIRKLESAEHGKTRFLWEKIFKEDSQTFVDYYYFIRTKENVIYVVEEDGATVPCCKRTIPDETGRFGF